MQLIDVLGLAPLRILSHSMGGAVSLFYTGVFPKAVHKLVAIEGMGIPAEAAARMQGENPHLSTEQARHLTTHGVARNEDGTFSWKFDNSNRPLFPQRLTLHLG